MKKIFGIMLSLLIALELCGMSIYAIENSYTDIKNHWAESSIKRWSEYDIVQGSNGEFEPNGQLTCAQLATILTRLLKLPAAPDAGFTDNPSNAWYYDAINRCTAAGILKGNGDGTVTPNAPISRERAMVMLSRALGIEPLDSTNLSEFSDATLVSPYAQGYIAALIEAGIVGGVTADRLAPQENITRAATVTVLDRAISIYANENGKEIDASNAAGIILIAAENVKVINAPSGVSVIVAEGVDHATVNGVSVAGGSSYVVKEKESKPVSGGSGSSTSGDSSGGDVPSPSYTLSNIRFEKAQNGDEYYLAWDSSVTDDAFYRLYTTTNGGTTWEEQNYAYECKSRVQMMFSGKGLRVNLYMVDVLGPVASVENLNLLFDVTEERANLDSLSVTFERVDNHYKAIFSGLRPETQSVMYVDGIDFDFRVDADAQGNAALELDSVWNDLIENGKYVIYSFGNYTLDANGNRLSYTVYQHCEPTPCLAANQYIQNVHLEKNGNAYVWAWDCPENYRGYYKTYVKYGNATDWNVRIGQIRRHWVWADVETNGSGFRVEAYKNGNELTPMASVEIPDITYSVTNLKNKVDGITASFIKSGERYTAYFTGLPAETLVAVDFISSDNADRHRDMTDTRGSVSFLIPSDEIDLIENGTYTIYSYDNYVLNGNQLSYTVYQLCEPTPCLITNPCIRNIHLEKDGNAYIWAWDSYGQENIDYYRTYVKYGDASDWTVRTDQTRLNYALVDIETSGSGFRVEAYSNEDKSTPLASVEIPGIKYLVTNVKAETAGIVADFTKSYLGYTVDLTGLPAETFTAINYVSSGRSGWDWGRTDSQGSVSLFIKSGDENGLFENGTYTVYSYDNYVLNGNQLSYTVYQHCEPTGCIEDIPEIGNATLDIYSFAAKADIDNVTNKIGAIHFDRPYTVNLEDGADISEWFSGIPDGLRILYKKGNSSSNKILFEIRGTPTNTVTNGIHYLRCVIPSNTIFVDGQLYPLKIQPNIFCSQIYVCDSFEYINYVKSWIDWDKVEKSDDIEDVIESLCEALRSTEKTTTGAVSSYDDNTIYLMIYVSANRGYKFSEDVDIDLSCYSGFRYKFSTLITFEGEEKPDKTEMDFGIDVEIDRDKLAEILSD